MKNILLVADHCKEYELAARETVIVPFSGVEKLSPPEATWDIIRYQIEKEEQQLEERTNPFANLIRGIKYVLYIPRPAITIAAVAMVLLVTLTVIKLSYEIIVK